MMDREVTIDWSENAWAGETVILSGDIGGTNANLAFVMKGDEGFRILLEVSTSSLDIDAIGPLVVRGLEELNVRYPDLRPELGCISGAGPVNGNCCTMSNLPWGVDGDALTREFGFPIRAINDFEAISFGVPLLDLDDPDQVTVMPHTNGNRPEPEGDTRLIVGAGTGLGVSMMLGDSEAARSVPSEGGHASFSSLDRETQEILDQLRKEVGWVVENEDLLSGKGIAALLRYYMESRGSQIDETLEEILNASASDQPRLVSRYASNHPVCRGVIRLFVKIYGRVSADFASIVLPKGGLFLAGGIVGKNEEFFLDGNQFIRFFEQNECVQVRNILKEIPVYIIRNYNISLLGAANAGWVAR
jgi:glucokinase